jgi:hypothetical protein
MNPHAGRTALLCALLACRTAAAVDGRVSGTITTVDPKARTITITGPKPGEKTSEYDVARKAKILVNGQEAAIDDLKAGQKATLTVQTDLDVVSRIEATGEGHPSPELLRLNELNTGAWDGEPWVSPDGLTIYWMAGSNTGPMIWAASRKDANSLFENKRLHFRGQCPTVTADGRQLYLIDRRTDGIKGFSIFVANRASLDAAFDRPREVPEFRSIHHPFGLALSQDGLSMYFTTRPDGARHSQIVESRRRTTSSKWQEPRPLPISLPDNFEGELSYPSLTADGLTLLCCHEGTKQPPSFMVWRRPASDQPFHEFEVLTLPGIKDFGGWCPRYVERTGEFFFCSQRVAADGYVDLWVVRDFKLPTRPRMAALTELNTESSDFSPWLSPDGLTIYWNVVPGKGQEPWIWSASRRATNAPFGNPKRLFPGIFPTVTADALRMVLLDRQGSLQIAERATTAALFPAPRMIEELRDQDHCWWPCLSGDGLTLYYARSGADESERIVYSTRRPRLDGRWGRPSVVRFGRSSVQPRILFPFVTPDDLGLICVDRHRSESGRNPLMVWSRTSPDEPFRDPHEIEIDGLTLPRGAAFFRYLPLTHELYFSANRGSTDLLVIRDVEVSRKATADGASK